MLNWYDAYQIDKMDTVTVSPKYQVVIPRSVREKLGIAVGQKVRVIALGDRLELVLVKSPRELKGFLRGIDTKFGRDHDRV